MKHFVIALSALMLPLTAQAQRSDLRAIRAAQNLAADLDNLQLEAQEVARMAHAPVVSQKAREIARDSRVLARKVDNQIVRELERGTRDLQVRRALNQLEPHIRGLVYEAQSMRAPAARNLEFAAARVKQSLRALERQLSNGPGPGPGPFPPGPGPGPGPFPPGPGPGPRPQFEATCRVVLETLWGNDIQDFYGFARGASEAVAVNLARQDGQQLCQYALSGLNKCTVANCEANFVGRH
jgi:hypothetical protein